jgi:acetylornithine deacetylase/succinyl-diaminopimelate desuccinylase-like protein
MDSPAARQVIAAVEAARGPAYLLPTAGGTLPLAPFEDILAAPVIIVPIANHDNNQHSHNENLRLQNLWDGIETMAALMAMR